MASIDIHGIPASGHSDIVRTGDSQRAIREIATKKGREVLMIRRKLEQREIHDGKYDQIVRAAKDDLKKLYADAGVEITEESFAPVYLIPKQYEPEFQNELQASNSFNAQSLGSVVFVQGEPFSLEDASAIHHEMHHGIGKVILVAHKNGETGFGQIGQMTYGSKSQGEALEEGTMRFFQNRFIVSDQSEVMKRSRREFAKTYKPGADITDKASDEIIRQRSKKVLENKHYEAAATLVEKIVQRASNLFGEEGGKKMEQKFLRARVRPKEKYDLVVILQ